MFAPVMSLADIGALILAGLLVLIGVWLLIKDPVRNPAAAETFTPDEPAQPEWFPMTVYVTPELHGRIMGYQDVQRFASVSAALRHLLVAGLHAEEQHLGSPPLNEDRVGS